jgi:hypothetical protein
MVSLFLALLAAFILRSYPEARKLKIEEHKKRLLLRSIVFLGCIPLLAAMYLTFWFSIEKIQDGKSIVGITGILFMAIFVPIVLYMQTVSVFSKFSFFDSQMKIMFGID